MAANRSILDQMTTVQMTYPFGDSEPKGEVISSKIDQLAAIYTSKFKYAWWA